MNSNAVGDEKQAAQIAEVLRLHLTEGLSVRAIARRVQLSRKIVGRILGRAYDQGGRRAAPGSDGDGGATKEGAAPRTSILDPYLPTVRALLKDTPELRAPAVLERLRPLGYTGGISILRDRIRTLRPRPAREAFLSRDFAPGAAAEVDWADFGYALPGCPRRVSAFVMTLCYSRLMFLCFTLSQTLGALLRAMERAVSFFGGTTTVDIFDNMKTVVRSHTPRATVFNMRFLEYARNRRFAVTACNPHRPNEKGGVERAIYFVRERFWKGRRFRDLDDLNQQAGLWRDSFGNGRVHELTGKVPQLVFENEERRLLRPILPGDAGVDDIETTGVNKSFRITFDRNRYSVPWRLVGQTVLVRADDATVSIFLGPKQVALHSRSWGVGGDFEHPSHKAGLLDRKPRAAACGLPPALIELGDDGGRYFKLVAAGQRSLRRETERIVFLCEIFGAAPTCAAVREVLATGHVGAEYVEHVLRHKKGLSPAPAPLRLNNPALDSISLREPDLSIYDQLVPASMTRDPGPAPSPPPTGSEHLGSTDSIPDSQQQTNLEPDA